MEPLSPSSSALRSPASGSSAKAQMKMDSPKTTDRLVSEVNSLVHTEPTFQSSVAAFPNAGQPVLDTTMKDMLMFLQTSLLTNFSSLIYKFSSDLQIMGDRVQYIENKIDECTTTVNDLIDAHEENKDDHLKIQAKLPDLEDRSRCNNVELRVVPESVPSQDLQKYVI